MDLVIWPVIRRNTLKFNPALGKAPAMNPRILVLAAALLLTRSMGLAASFMDLTSLVPGSGGATFSGTIDGVGVTGTLSSGGNVTINPVGLGVGLSTILNTSPQWSYGTVYTPTSATDDRVGFSQASGPDGLVSLVFASPMTDLIFHIAHLDRSLLDFSPSIGGGFTGLTLLSGNGGADFDGLGAGGLTIFDIDPSTIDGTPETAPPPLAGARAAYGSVLLSGTYTTLDFAVIYLGAGPPVENANFTLATPEPGVASLTAMGVIGIILRRRRRG